MAPSTAFRPIAHIQPAAQAQELPVLRLTLQGPDGEIHRMTILSTVESRGPFSRATIEQIEVLAGLANLRVLEIHRLSHIHLEMRSHPEEVPHGVV